MMEWSTGLPIQSQIGLPWLFSSSCISTGIGIEAVPFPANRTTLINAIAKAGRYFFPTARTIIDIGAEESRVVRFDEKGDVTDFALNDMCAAGAGSFIEAMSRALEVKIEDFAQLSLKAEKAVLLNAQCVVFAESEVVSLIHQQVDKSEIARAVYDAISERISFMVKRLVMAPDLVIVGGVANDSGLINSINRKLNVAVLVPANPEYGAALGAAIYGQGLG